MAERRIRGVRLTREERLEVRRPSVTEVVLQRKRPLPGALQRPPRGCWIRPKECQLEGAASAWIVKSVAVWSAMGPRSHASGR